MEQQGPTSTGEGVVWSSDKTKKLVSRPTRDGTQHNPELNPDNASQIPTTSDRQQEGTEAMEDTGGKAEVRVGGRLAQFWEHWQSLSPYIAAQLKEGFRLPWRSRPSLRQARQPTLSPLEMAQVDREIERALKKHAIIQIHPAEVACLNPIFTVAKKDTEERRMIVDLRQVNKHLIVPKFKMTTFREAKQLITPGCWMTKIDIKDAFWHLPIHPADQPYLAFQWRGITYTHRVAPFGLSISPLFLTKTMRPLMAKLNSTGISSCIYVDDALIVDESCQKTQEATAVAVRTIEEAGFIINREKSQLNPSQEVTYLGMTIETKTMTVRTPRGKLNKTKMAIKKMILTPQWTVREIASLVGLLNSLADGLFQTRVFTTGLQQWKRSWQEGDWDAPLDPSAAALSNLQWWSENLPRLNGRSLLLMKTEGTLTTDASTLSWGAIWESPGLDPVHTHGHFDQEQVGWHIGEKELLAVSLAVQALKAQVKGKTILLRTDSMTTMIGVNKMGSNSPKIAVLIDKLFMILEAQQTHIRAVYIPSEENPADALSRKKPANSDWQLNPEIFAECCQIWGTPTIDLFASFQNKQLPRFTSYNPQPQAVGVDALSRSWTEFSWVNPPFAIIHRVLNKIIEDQATVIMVIPIWTACPWFTTAMRLMVDIPLVVNRARAIHLPLLHRVEQVEAQNPTWTTCISKLSGKISEQQDWKRQWQSHSPDTLPSALKEAVLQRGNYGPYTAQDCNAIHILSQILTSSITGLPLWAHSDTSEQH